MLKIDHGSAQSALEHAPMGVMMVGANQVISWANTAMSEFLGTTPEQIQGRLLAELQSTQLRKNEFNENLWCASNPALPQYERWLILLEKQISPSSTVYYFVDSTELVKLKAEKQNLLDQLENASTNDPLTGVLNKKALRQSLEPQVSRSRRYDNPLSMIILQIDGFNSSDAAISPVNEHVLKAVSFYLRDQMRWVDLVGRTDDNEFTLVLPETRYPDAERLAHKINNRLSQLSLPDTPSITVAIDCKIGIAEWEKGDDANNLVQKAHRGLERLAETA